MLIFKLILAIFVFQFASLNLYSQTKDKSHKSTNGNYEIQLVHVFGEEFSEDKDLLFNPNGIVLDDDNNYYILDNGNYRVIKYDKNHNFVSQVGQQGQGPADFAKTEVITNDGEFLYIIDEGNYKIMKFDLNLKFVSTFKLDPFPGGLYFKNNFFYSIGLNARKRATAEMPLIIKYDSKFEKVYDIGKFQVFDNYIKMAQLNRFSIVINNVDEILTSYKYKNKVVKYSSDGKEIFSLERKLKYEIEKEDTKKKQDIKYYDIPAYDIVSRGISVDKKDNFWVLAPLEKKEVKMQVFSMKQGERVTNSDIKQSTSKPISHYLEIFDNNGKSIDEIVLDFHVSNIFVFGERLFLIDTSQKMVIYEYVILWK